MYIQKTVTGVCMKISTEYTISNRRAVNYNKRPSFKRNWAEHASWGAKYIKETGKADFKLFTFPDAKKVFVEIGKKAENKFGNLWEKIVKIMAIQGAAFSIDQVIAENDDTSIHELENKGDGIFETRDIPAEENSQYRFVIITNDNQVNLVKDPYSKQQPNIKGWSEIYNPDNYEWKNTDWLEGKDTRRIIRKPEESLRGLENLIIEEINIPTLSEEGTFNKAKAHIDKIAERGIATAIELLPVENTFSKQWGYDGVDKFAVNTNLGTAAELKDLIDYAHGKGLNVIMDMVPNHMGTDGDFLSKTGPYENGSGDFGSLFNYEGIHNRYVRDFMANAALWWANEFKVDGLRLDMTKLCDSDYLLKQIVAEVNEHNPKIFLIAEDGKDNREKITQYNKFEMTHDNELAMIDQGVDNIAYRRFNSDPGEIGFDTEWDFNLMHAIKEPLSDPNFFNLDAIDSAIWNSKYRTKFALSHDEIGNYDGTRLAAKAMVSELDLFNKVKGTEVGEKGQNAGKLAQWLVEKILSGELDEMSMEELHRQAKEIGLKDNEHLAPKKIKTAFETSKAKQKLCLGTIMTIPGPKMYFQGDDVMDLSTFKFFRELSDEKEKRAINDPDTLKLYKQKGYDTLESVARPQSMLGRIKPKDTAFMQESYDYIKDLTDLVKKTPALQKGEIKGTIKDYIHKVHAHILSDGNEEYMVVKNFGQRFHSKEYGVSNFPDGEWIEIFNGDDKKYGGSGYINSDRDTNISKNNQNLNLAPNSLLILKKV